MIVWILCNFYIFYGLLIPIAVAFGIKFAIKKLRGKLDLKNEVDISGKVVIVTGASDGIGKATAEAFATRGAKIILACRNLDKAQTVVRDIRQKTKNGELIVMQLDLASVASIRKFVLDFESAFGDTGLSILVNNAGFPHTPGTERQFTQDGFEAVFGVNHLGHFLLTNLLLPQLEKASKNLPFASRIVIVTSGAHAFGELHFDDLTYDKTPLHDWKFMSKLYCNSKLANALFNVELAKRLRAKKVNVNCYALCPVFVETTGVSDFLKAAQINFFVKNILIPIYQFFSLKDVYEGAETTIYCSLSKYLEHHSGEMYRNCQFWDYSQRAKLKEEDAAKLWETSEIMLKNK